MVIRMHYDVNVNEDLLYLLLPSSLYALLTFVYMLSALLWEGNPSQSLVC